MSRSKIAGVRDSALNPSAPVCPESHTPTTGGSLLLRVTGRLWNPQTARQGAGANPWVPRPLAARVRPASGFGSWEGVLGHCVPEPIQVALAARVSRAPGRAPGLWPLSQQLLWRTRQAGAARDSTS